MLHSASRDGGEFTLRAEVHQDHVRIEVEDAGGPWRGGPRDDGRPHGFDVVDAIARPRNWAWTGTPAGAPPGPGSASEKRMTILPSPEEASRIIPLPPRPGELVRVLGQKHGVWRVAEDDPDSDLYAECTDADTVIGYITAHV